jgi:hypothetical protein
MSDFMDGLGGVTPLPAEQFRDEYGNRSIRMGRGTGVSYRGFTIKEKGDFGSHGHYIRGHHVKHGYVVTDGGIINVMPAATWFLTVDDAMKAIDDLITAHNIRREGRAEHPFWALHRFRANAEERAPELAMLLQRVMDNKDVFYDLDDDLQQAIADTLNRIDDNCDMRGRRGPVGGPWTRDGERTTGRFGVLPAAGDAA